MGFSPEADEEISFALLAPWPVQYVNAETGRIYEPHHDEEAAFLADDEPRYGLAKGGEGGGKTTLGIIKALERLRRGMSGIMASPDLEHFKKSLWPEFKRWCPWHRVIPRHQYRSEIGWEPTKAFTLVFCSELGTYSELICGGAKETEIETWHGPNVNFAYLDEIRRHKTAIALKTFDGRVRIPGPHGEPPQLFITTTPRKHWLYLFFGPEKKNDPKAAFKRDSKVITLLTIDNEANLQPGFVERRRQTLTESEARVLLEAAWEDIEETTRFLMSMLWWDQCREELPALDAREPCVIALDAAVSGDHFALVLTTRHPDPDRRRRHVAVRYVQTWEARSGLKIDYRGTDAEPGPERVVRELCARFNVKQVAYDPYQLHDMATRLNNERVVWCEEFTQQKPRLIADKGLLDLIMNKRLAHDGNPLLREHIDNADRKPDTENRRLRIVKRENELKIDLAVALSMSAARCLELRL